MTEPGSPRPRVPAWRIAAGVVVLVIFGILGIRMVPLYVHNFELQRFVEDMTRRVENQTKPDNLLKGLVLEKAESLGLPVRADNVQVEHHEDSLRIRVRYVVRVELPLYTVDLHFYPGAGSR